MDKQFEIRVFGKKGCPKCKTLNKRLDSLLSKDEWAHFEKKYFDVQTEDGLVEFCNAECINPQRIPAFVVAKKHGQDTNGNDAAELIPNPAPEEYDEVCKDSKLYVYLGLQTDYTDSGQGVISPKMIKSVLNEACETAKAGAVCGI